MTTPTQTSATWEQSVLLAVQAAVAPVSLLARASQPGDAAFIVELYCDSRSGEVAHWGWDAAATRQFLQMQQRAQAASYAANYPTACHILLESNTQPMGRILVDHSTDELRLVDIALLSAYRSRGIGSIILQTLQSTAAMHGMPINLSVHVDNRAVSLYSRYGFTETGRNEVYLSMRWSPA